MKKHALLTAFLFALVFTCSAQKSFIGQTMAQVKDFWSTEVSEEYFDTGKYDDTGEEYFMIASKNVGRPEFSATFVNGKCTEQSAVIKSTDVSVYKARLKKLGFVYSAKTDDFRKSGTKYAWKIKEAFGIFTLDAKKL